MAQELIDIDARALELFVLLAKRQHYGAAAREAEIAQPALSQHVKRLEATLGLRLFNRSARSVSPTAAGRALLPFAREVLGELAALERLRHRFDRMRSGAVRLGVSVPMGRSTSESVVSELADRLWGHHELQVVELPPRTIRRSLIDGTIDLALTLDATPLSDLGGVSAPVAFDLRSAIVPRTHPLGRRRRAQQSDLLAERPLDLDPAAFGPAALWSPNQLPPAEGVIRDLGELRDALIMERGICLMPDADASSLVDRSLARVPIVDAPPVAYSFVWCGATPPLPEELLLGDVDLLEQRA